MLSIKKSVSAFAGLLLLTGAVGCAQGTVPTAPAAAESFLTGRGMASTGPSSSIIFVIDSNIKGSESQLTGFDGVNQVTFNTTKGVFTAVFDTGTVFRNAQLDKFHPTDPCRDIAAAYNQAGSVSDSGGVFSAITSMAANGCLARILIEKSVPPNPIKSFRPLATF